MVVKGEFEAKYKSVDYESVLLIERCLSSLNCNGPANNTRVKPDDKWHL